MPHRGTCLLAPLVAIGLMIGGCGEPAATPPEQASNNPARVEAGLYLPSIDPNDFVDSIDNPYMPLIPGTVLTYVGNADGELEREELVVTYETKEILGVTTTVVHDQVFLKGVLAEDTYDWFAQDRLGNVWYFGESSRDIEHEKVVSRKGSWEAGVDGAQPGVVMPGDPYVGDFYRQEFYEGEAEDTAKVLRLHESVTVPHGSFDNVLVTEDRNPLEPELLENK